jgi:hypothetical protein
VRDSRSTSQNVVQGHFFRFQHNKVFIKCDAAGALSVHRQTFTQA